MELINATERMAAEGHHTRNELWEPTTISVRWLPDGRADVVVASTVTAYDVIDANGAVVESVPSQELSQTWAISAGLKVLDVDAR
jgi:hypothetical protein